MRILVAEGDQAVAEVLSEALKDEGHQVTRVSSAAELFELAPAQPWDLLLVDTFGPGYVEPDDRLAAYVSALSRFAPVVLMSGHSWASRLTPGQLGVAGLLPKPFDLDVLFLVVDNSRRHRGLPQ